MINKCRNFLWRILGIDRVQILNKLDYTLLKDDTYSKIGIGSYDNGAKVWRWTKAPLIIGNYCSIAHGVEFIIDEGYHNSSEITSYPFYNHRTKLEDFKDYKDVFQQKEGIRIGNDVWIGINVIILPGIKIGNGVTIAAGSVVNRDLPDYSICGGVPARILNMKYSETHIQKMNDIAWWNWDKKLIAERNKDFYLPLNDFLNKYLE